VIQLLKGYRSNVVALYAVGHVTQKNYEEVYVPAIESALARHDKIRLYYQIGPDFCGIDPGAFWADARVGFENLPRLERNAVVTDVEWIRLSMMAFGLLMPGQARVFSLADAHAGRKWIAGA